MPSSSSSASAMSGTTKVLVGVATGILLVGAITAAVLLATLSGGTDITTDETPPPSDEPDSSCVSPIPSTASPSLAADITLHCNNFTGVFTIRNGSNPEPQGSAVRENGGIYHQRSFGFANNLANQRMAPESRFLIGSNSKLFVAIALYQLEEAGKVNLSHSIADYISAADLVDVFGFPNGTTTYCPQVQTSTNGPGAGACQTITFTQILGMSSNIPDIDWYIQAMPYTGSWANILGRFMTRPLLATPGSTFFYSNPSFQLATWFVETISGMSFKMYLETKIFQPLGLENTYYPLTNGMFHQDPMRTQDMNYYLNGDNASEVLSTGTCIGSDYAPGTISGAGGLISTQGDIANMWFDLFNFTQVVATGSRSQQYPYLGGGILSADSVFEIVKARTTVVAGYYFTQGLAIITSNATNPIPNQILYTGSMGCTVTTNQLNLDTKPFPTLMQAWSSANVFYPTSSAFATATSAAATGSWVDRITNWRRAAGNSGLVYSFMAYYEQWVQ